MDFQSVRIRLDRTSVTPALRGTGWNPMLLGQAPSASSTLRMGWHALTIGKGVARIDFTAHTPIAVRSGRATQILGFDAAQAARQHRPGKTQQQRAIPAATSAGLNRVGCLGNNDQNRANSLDPQSLRRH